MLLILLTFSSCNTRKEEIHCSNVTCGETLRACYNPLVPGYKITFKKDESGSMSCCLESKRTFLCPPWRDSDPTLVLVSLNTVYQEGLIPQEKSCEAKVDEKAEQLKNLFSNESSFKSLLNFYYKDLFGNEDVVKLYASGKPANLDSLCNRIKVGIDRWNAGSPYSPFVIFIKDTGTLIPIGNVVVGKGSNDHVAEAAIIINHKYWQKRYGKRVQKLISARYIPELRNHTLPDNGGRLKVIEATASEANKASVKIIESSGGKVEGSTDEYQSGSAKLVYRMPVYYPVCAWHGFSKLSKCLPFLSLCSSSKDSNVKSHIDSIWGRG